MTVYPVLTFDYDENGEPFVQCLAVFELKKEATSFLLQRENDYNDIWIDEVKYYERPALDGCGIHIG